MNRFWFIPLLLSPELIMEWLVVVRREGKYQGRWMVAKQLWGALWTLVTKGAVSREKYHQRIGACSVCPVYDWDLKRCRPWNNAPTGCGCYVPWYALTKDEKCWAKKNAPDLGFGWD